MSYCSHRVHALDVVVVEAVEGDGAIGLSRVVALPMCDGVHGGDGDESEVAPHRLMVIFEIDKPLCSLHFFCKTVRIMKHLCQQ